MCGIPWHFADHLEFSHVLWKCLSHSIFPHWKCLWMACHVIPNYTIASCRPLELEQSPLAGDQAGCQVWFTSLAPRNSPPERRLDGTRPSSHQDPCMSFSFMLPASCVTLTFQRLLLLNIKFNSLMCWKFDDKSIHDVICTTCMSCFQSQPFSSLPGGFCVSGPDRLRCRSHQGNVLGFLLHVLRLWGCAEALDGVVGVLVRRMAMH